MLMESLAYASIDRLALESLRLEKCKTAEAHKFSMKPAAVERFVYIIRGNVSFDLEMLAEMVRQGVEQAMSRSNDLDRQRNEYLRQINEKDYNPEISTSSINRAQQRMNRRAGTTIVPVGT